MTYESDEDSWADGEPVELYEFTMGGTSWYYTSSNIQVLYNTNIYLPALISRGSIEQTSESAKNEVSVSMHRSVSFATQFIGYPPESTISFKLHRGHGSNFVTYWVGNVGLFSFGKDTVELTIIPPHRGGTMSALRRKYQTNCTYPLYSPECQIVKGDATWYILGNITTIVAKTITAAIFATKADDWFTGGEIKSGTSQRLITSHTGDTITIVLPMALVSAGDAFQAWAGCAHSYDVCGSKFSNKINFGGQPWLPDKNPFVGDPIA